jgi:hypothetical protein
MDGLFTSAGPITGEKQFVIAGSQALHGKFPKQEQIRAAIERDFGRL